jgi:UDP-3-O-[3-hydroxymyristoyl] glucosamine N-acyltransferase
MTGPGFSLREIADHLAGRLEGDPDLRIVRVQAPEAAGAQEIAVVFHPRVLRHLAPSAAALVLADNIDPPVRPAAMIRIADPQRAFVSLLQLFHPERRRSGIAAGAHVDPTATLAPGVYLAAGAVVGAGARLAAGVQIHANAVVGDDVVIGEDSIIYPNVTLYPGSRLGRRVRIHAGAVVGSDGFGFQPQADGSLLKVPQIGRVEIGDDVEIGANCTIDRGTLAATTLAAGVKLDNLVHIGHNCSIGEHCCLVAQVGISGSVAIGARSKLMGQAGVVPHVHLAADTVVGAQAGVIGDLAGGEWFGAPAIAAAQARRAYPLIGRLPEQRRRIAALERRCAALEDALAQPRHTAGVEPDRARRTARPSDRDASGPRGE